MKVQTQTIKEINNDNLADSKEVSEHVQPDNEIVKVKVDDIVVRKGFNLRKDFKDVTTLAASINAMGLLTPITVDILKDGSAVLTDGERRYRALVELRSQNKEQAARFEYVFASTNGSKMTEADRVIAMMAHNNGKPLNAVEEAEGFLRLRDEFKIDLTTVAKKVGRSVPYVEQRLILAKATAAEKQLVIDKQISATALMNFARQEKDPVKRTAAITEKLVKAKEKGKTTKAKGKGKAAPKAKIKVKDVKQVPLTKECDAILELVKAANKLTNDTKLANVLFEIDAKVRALKEAVR